MKELKSPIMKQLLQRGIKKAKNKNDPGDGYMVNLISETRRNGWHYQVEFVHDERFYKHPYILVYAFKPPIMGSAIATYYLTKEL